MKKHDLPWQKPKSIEEEPKVDKYLQNIFDSPSCKLAMEDVDFLNSDETRGVRLQIDYQKVETILKKHGIKNTIVVFGSARIKEPQSAKKELGKAKKLFEQNRDSKTLLRELKRVEKMLEKSSYYEEAREFGRLVGKYGKGPTDNTTVIMTGGGPGIMEAANRGAHDVGAKSIGLNIELPKEQYPNPYIAPELCFKIHYFGIRKLHFMQRAAAIVLFPGGYGTLDELFDVLTLIQTRKTPSIPVVFVGKKYWSNLINFQLLVEEGTINPEDLSIMTFKENAKEAWEYIIKWYEKRDINI